jgi:DNA modification methylase
MKPTVIIGDCHLFLGDCREILPHLPKVDLVLTDPPYGIGASAGTGKYGRLKIESSGDLCWDSQVPDENTFNLVISAGVNKIIFGGNYFDLPPSRNFIIWDKGAGFKARDFAECEMAWCSWDGNARLISYDPLANRDYKFKEHPTQKPLRVIEWCLNLAPKTTSTVSDPFAGSGTTGVACVRMSKTFYGIEREPKYFDIMCERIEQA